MSGARLGGASAPSSAFLPRNQEITPENKMACFSRVLLDFSAIAPSRLRPPADPKNPLCGDTEHRVSIARRPEIRLSWGPLPLAKIGETPDGHNPSDVPGKHEWLFVPHSKHHNSAQDATGPDVVDQLASCERKISVPCITQVTGGVAGPLCPLCAHGFAELVRMSRLPPDTSLLQLIVFLRGFETGGRGG
jgi:hypothetical protein